MPIGPSLRAAIFGHGAAVATFGGRGNVRRLRPTCYLTSVSEEARSRKRADERLFERLDLRQAEPSASQSDSAYSVGRRWNRSRETDLVHARASQRTRIKVAITSDQFQAGHLQQEWKFLRKKLTQAKRCHLTCTSPGLSRAPSRHPDLPDGIIGSHLFDGEGRRRGGIHLARARDEIGRDY